MLELTKWWLTYKMTYWTMKDKVQLKTDTGRFHEAKLTQIAVCVVTNYAN